MPKTKQKQNDNKRFMNFNSAVLNLKANSDHAIDQKLIQITQNFTTTIVGMQHKLAVLEDVLKQKKVLSEQELKDNALLRLETMQGFVESISAAEEGSPLKVSVKEEVVGKEDPNLGYRDSFMIVGKNDIHPAIDKLVVGATKSEKREVVLPDPENKEIERRLTVIVDKVYLNPARNKNVTPSAESQNQA